MVDSLDLSGLVPPAERPFVPFDQQETVQETVWFNPTERDVMLKLPVGTKPVYTESAKARIREMRTRSPLQYKEWKSGERTVIIPKGTKRAISSDFDQAIQQTQCLEVECTAWRLYCRDRTHHKQVMGGLGPQLVNTTCQHRPVTHPSLIPELQMAEAAKTKAYEAVLAKQAADTALVLAQAKAMEAETSAKAQTDSKAHENESGRKKDK